MPVITYSKTGGMALDTLEKLYPERIKRLYIDYSEGINILDIMQVASDLEVVEKTSTLIFLIKNLFECFT
jgi:succinyl-CoA synthetase beta subunit